MKKLYKEKILKILEKKKELSFYDLMKDLNLTKEKQKTIFKDEIATYFKEGFLIKSKDNKITLPKHLDLVLCKVNRINDTFIFIENKETQEEYFCRTYNDKNLLIGDEVFAMIDKRYKKKKDTDKESAKIVKIVQRNNLYLVGEYFEEDEQPKALVDIDKTQKTIRLEKSQKAINGQKLALEERKTANGFEWFIHAVLGHKDEPTTEILSLLYKYGIKSSFDEATLQQANDIPDTISKEDLQHRLDLRNQCIITIDGADAKDLDDAVGLIELENGNVQLSVHIADVSHYVQEGSAIDEEAAERGTSVYLTNKVVPMLPQKLSNQICSLLPNQDRLTLSCIMEINERGDVVHYEIRESVICTDFRMTYDDVNEIVLDKNESLRETYRSIVPMLEKMHQLSLRLKQKRNRLGAIEFEDNECKIIVDEENKPVGIKVVNRRDAEKMIEEFMLIANETVATCFSKNEVPAVYRNHGKPSKERAEQVSDLLSRLGFGEAVLTDVEDSKQIQHMLEQIKGETFEKTIQLLAIRMMAKAVYEKDNKGHYGLAKEFYTHFTSPIRRYPDLIVHRLLREYFIFNQRNKKVKDKNEKQLDKIASQSSKCEQKAAEAERELLEIKKAEYMAAFLGDEFTGVISGFSEKGIFVTLENTVTGFILFDGMNERWSFDKDMYCARGIHNEDILKIGDTLKVELLNADKYTKKIDFKLLEQIETVETE